MPTSAVKIICGLGNPGRAYSKHRHNVGFMVADEIGRKNNIAITKNAFGAKIGKGFLNGKNVIIAKPQKYMNLSGSSVSAIVGYFGSALENLIVIHDDIDIPLGSFKFCIGSGHGGHNGVKSIIEELGSGDFYRVRVGVGRPPENMDPADYVLQEFLKEEKKKVPEIMARAADAALELIIKGLRFVQQKYH